MRCPEAAKAIELTHFLSAFQELHPYQRAGDKFLANRYLLPLSSELRRANRVDASSGRPSRKGRVTR